MKRRCLLHFGPVDDRHRLRQAFRPDEGSRRFLDLQFGYHVDTTAWAFIVALYKPLEDTLFVKRVGASLGKYPNVPLLVGTETDGAHLGFFARNADVVVTEIADVAACR